MINGLFYKSPSSTYAGESAIEACTELTIVDSKLDFSEASVQLVELVNLSDEEVAISKRNRDQCKSR